MNPTQTPKTPDTASVSKNTENVDHTRRKIASAGLGGSAVLITLASRPVLGATCMTPSAAGSGNHSQHVNNLSCTLKTAVDFIAMVTDKGFTPGDSSPSGWPTAYKPDTLFHAFFTVGTSFMNYRDSVSAVSYTLFEVLVGKKWPRKTEGVNAGALEKINNNEDLSKWAVISPNKQSNLAIPFAVALLNAAPPNNYYVVLPDVGEPSVWGIADEYATKGFYEPVAGKKWYADTIEDYLENPGSVF